jgi:hypothetical protein
LEISFPIKGAQLAHKLSQVNKIKDYDRGNPAKNRLFEYEKEMHSKHAKNQSRISAKYN